MWHSPIAISEPPRGTKHFPQQVLIHKWFPVCWGMLKKGFKSPLRPSLGHASVNRLTSCKMCDRTLFELVVWLHMLHCVGVISFSLPWLIGARFYTPSQWDCTLEALRTVVLLSKSILHAVLNIEHWTLNNEHLTLHIVHAMLNINIKHWTMFMLHWTLIIVHAALNIWFHIIFQWLPTGSGDGPQEAKIVRCDSF